MNDRRQNSTSSVVNCNNPSQCFPTGFTGLTGFRRNPANLVNPVKIALGKAIPFHDTRVVLATGCEPYRADNNLGEG